MTAAPADATTQGPTATGTFTVLAADKLADEGLEWLESQPDCRVLNKPGLSEAEYGAMLAEGGIHAMIVRSGIKVTAEVLREPRDLRIVARAGVGVDNIDLAAATDKGILVVNTAEASTVTTAEHAFTLLCAMARQVGPAYKTMAEGGWDRSKFKGRQLAGKTLGVVGFGRIGQTLAKRALAFDMDVLAYDPFIAAETMLDGKVKMYRDFEDILPHCDVLSFHVPLNDQTRGMLNKDTFAKCRKGVMVVNASRGGVVDEQDLLAALDDGACGGAALDVFSEEPPPEDSPLRRHPKLLVTPHLGASTVEAQQAVSVDAGMACLAYLRGEGIKGAVNAGDLRVDLDEMQHCYADLAGRMATILDPMITRGIAEIRIEVTGKALQAAASTIERHAVMNLLKGHLDVPVNVINVNQVAQDRGIHVRTTQVDQDAGMATELSIEVVGPKSAVDADTPPPDRSRRIVGRVYDDLQPRIVEVNGYHMDMVPEGDMLLLQNEDKPGMIGLVGSEFGSAEVNIADMSISRRRDIGDVYTALMVLKIDAPAPDDLLARLRARPGILKVATIKLPAAPQTT